MLPVSNNYHYPFNLLHVWTLLCLLLLLAHFCTPSCQWLHLSCRYVCTRGDVCGRKVRCRSSSNCCYDCKGHFYVLCRSSRPPPMRIDCGSRILVCHKTEPVILYRIVLLSPSP